MSSQASNEAATGDSIKTPYKEQLDKAAEKIKSPPAGTNEEPKETLLDKVTDYVPAVGKLLGKEEKKKDELPDEPATKPSGPPHRPVHDTQIEEFVRDQHRSQNINGVME
ncbi:hypothetical protein NKR19_g2452 [Coniochaeta hoffmannii]|uniref:Uncharacterized protein n=1 Tax=Coniochaeta hoffmannii TaxID=91930 RepID=A0AA38VS50_9PEZI|nr:hypothetical protein NKR19_g2452 [Coniochaeta hoffmannii]